MKPRSPRAVMALVRCPIVDYFTIRATPDTPISRPAARKSDRDISFLHLRPAYLRCFTVPRSAPRIQPGHRYLRVWHDDAFLSFPGRKEMNTFGVAREFYPLFLSPLFCFLSRNFLIWNKNSKMQLKIPILRREQKSTVVRICVAKS